MKVLTLALIFTALLIAGCTVYQTAPGVYATAPVSKFDQSWSAAVGAFADQSLRITSENRSAGILRGTRDGIEVTGNIRTQADGSVRVQFDTSGATGRDPDLINRITSSYNSRMGR